MVLSLRKWIRVIYRFLLLLMSSVDHKSDGFTKITKIRLWSVDQRNLPNTLIIAILLCFICSFWGNIFDGYSSGDMVFRSLEGIHPDGWISDSSSSRWYSSRWYSSRWYSSRWYSSRWYSSRWYSSRWYSFRWYSSRWYSSRWYSSRWYSSRWMDSDSFHPDGIHLDGIHLDGIHLDGIHPDGIHLDGIHPYNSHIHDMNNLETFNSFLVRSILLPVCLLHWLCHDSCWLFECHAMLGVSYSPHIRCALYWLEYSSHIYSSSIEFFHGVLPWRLSSSVEFFHGDRVLPWRWSSSMEFFSLSYLGLYIYLISTINSLYILPWISECSL